MINSMVIISESTFPCTTVTFCLHSKMSSLYLQLPISLLVFLKLSCFTLKYFSMNEEGHTTLIIFCLSNSLPQITA